MIIKRPVYNQQLKCVAYEILCSEQLEQPNNELDSEVLSKLISTSESQLPLFIPFEFRSIIEQFSPPIPNPIILKLAAAEIDTKYTKEEVSESLFSIALLIDSPQQLAWLNFADYIGLTEQLMNGNDVTKVVNFSKAKQRKVIAYGLAQPLNFDKCKSMTMDFFCGDFLLKPDLDDQVEIAGNKLSVLQLIKSLQQEDCNLQDISEIIQADPIISFQLLKLANSAGFSGGNPIHSIQQAIARLGIINLKNWVMLFSMKNISDKPKEVLDSGLIRANMAQALAKASSNVNVRGAYTAGLLSILDCLLNKPMPDLLSQIALDEDITNALISQTGPIGELLSLVIAYESGDWDKVTAQNVHGIDLSELYINSLELISTSNSVFG